MTTSGTVTFRNNRDEIIQGALRLCMAIDPENTAAITTTQTSNAAQALNQMVKGWEAIGLQLWERKTGVIFPQKSQGIFVLGSPGPAGDHACLSTPLGSGFVQTTLASAAASGASTIVVTTVTGLSTTGITATSILTTYNIGIQLDGGSTQWTTVNGAPSGTTVTLTATLTGAAAAGNNVFCYQTKLTRPLRILDAFCHQLNGSATGYPTSGGTKIPIRIISKDEYNRFGSASSTGTPVQLAYDPQTNAGHVYLYPIFDAATKLVYIEFTRAIDDFSSSSDDFDLPQEWGEALKYNLAWRIAPEYAMPKERYDMIKELALMTFDSVKGYDQEPASLLIQPWDWMYHGGR
jgi:hypothetical protein